MATSRIGRDVEGIDAITSHLTQTNLAEETTRPAIEPPTGKAEMDAITNCLSQTALKEDRIDGEADDEEDEDSLFLPEGPVSEEVRQRQAAEAAVEATAAKQREEDEQTSAVLSTACDMWSIDNNEEAKAKREAQRIQDRLQQEHDNRVQVLEAAEARRRADANHAAAWKKWVEDKAKARLLAANRAAQEAEEEEAGQKLAHADALAIQNALQTEALEREWQEQARANQAKEEADNRLRQEWSQARDNVIAALNAASAEGNTRGGQYWQQQQAESLAHYEAVVSGRAENATPLQQQQQHNHQQQQPQQHLGCFFFDDMEITSDEEIGDGTFTAMDTTSNTEGVGETIMDWEPVEEVMLLPAQPRLPLVPLTEPPRFFGQAATLVPTAASAADLAKPLRLPSFGEALKALRTSTLTPTSPQSPAAPPPPAASPSPPPPPSPSPAPLSLPPPPPSPSPPPAPLPIAPPPPSPPPASLPLSPPPRKVLKIALPQAPIRPVNRPIVHPWSPLGRILSRGQ